MSFMRKDFLSQQKRILFLLIFFFLLLGAVLIEWQTPHSFIFFLFSQYPREFYFSRFMEHIFLLLAQIFLLSYLFTRLMFIPLRKFFDNISTLMSAQSRFKTGEVPIKSFGDLKECVHDLLLENNQLNRTNEYYNLLLETMKDALVVIKPDSTMIFVNKAMCDLVGCTKETLVHKKMSEYFNVENGTDVFGEDQLNLLNEKKFLSEYNLVCQKTQGTLVPVEVSASVIKDSSGGLDSILCLVRDVSNARRMEEEIMIINQQLQDNQMQLKTANEELKLTLRISESLREDLSISTNRAEELAKVKSEFLANMSHEIRTPMTAIIGFSNLLKRTNLNQIQMNYLSSIISSGNLLISIINDILDVSKIEAGKIVLEEVDFNIQLLLNDVFRMIVARMEDFPLETYIDISQDVPLFLKGDPTRLKQILINLLGNSMKFTRKGSIGVIVSKEKESLDEGEVFLRFVIKDTGIGMSEDEIMSIFDAFSQADSSTTRQYGGTGLGLTICKSLIEIMNGHIWVKSEKNQGSEFIFTIPLSFADVQGDINQIKGINLLKGLKVLIVDDNQISGKINERLCKSLGIKVLAVLQSSSEGISMLHDLVAQRNIPDIVLSDLIMDGIDGYQFAREIQKMDCAKDLKVVAITIVPEIDQEMSNEYLFDGYILKPVTLFELAHVLIGIIDERLGKQYQFVDQIVCKADDFSEVRLLVVDDSMTNQLLLQACFDEIGVQADFADNGEQALEKLRESLDYDLVLMDLQMPVMDGIEATQIIRKELSDKIPIIAITADIVKVKDNIHEKYLMNDVIAKPFEIERLKEVLVRYKRKT